MAAEMLISGMETPLVPLGSTIAQKVREVRNSPRHVEKYVVPTMVSTNRASMSADVFTSVIPSDIKRVALDKIVLVYKSVADSQLPRTAVYAGLPDVYERYTSWPFALANVMSGPVAVVLPTARRAYMAYRMANDIPNNAAAYVNSLQTTSLSARVYFMSSATFLVRYACDAEYPQCFSLMIVDDAHSGDPATYTIKRMADHVASMVPMILTSPQFGLREDQLSESKYEVESRTFYPLAMDQWPTARFTGQPWHKRAISARTVIICPDELHVSMLGNYYKSGRLMVLTITEDTSPDDIDAIRAVLTASRGRAIVVLTLPQCVAGLDVAVDVVIDNTLVQSVVYNGRPCTISAEYRPAFWRELRESASILGRQDTGIYYRAIRQLSHGDDLDPCSDVYAYLWQTYVSAGESEDSYECLAWNIGFRSSLAAAHMLSSAVHPLVTKNYLDSQGAYYANAFPAVRYYLYRYSDSVVSAQTMDPSCECSWLPVYPQGTMFAELDSVAIRVPIMTNSLFVDFAVHVAAQSLAQVPNFCISGRSSGSDKPDENSTLPSWFRFRPRVSEEENTCVITGKTLVAASSVPENVRRFRDYGVPPRSSFRLVEKSSPRSTQGQVWYLADSQISTVEEEYTEEELVSSDTAADDAVYSRKPVPSSVLYPLDHVVEKTQMIYSDLSKLPAPTTVKPSDTEADDYEYLCELPNDRKRIKDLLAGKLVLRSLDTFDRRLLHNAFVRVWNTDVLSRVRCDDESRRATSPFVASRSPRVSLRRVLGTMTRIIHRDNILRHDHFQAMVDYYPEFARCGFALTLLVMR